LGGVRTWIAKVVTALRREGFTVARYVLDDSILPGSSFFSMHLSDVIRLIRLQKYDVALYFGSLPYLGSLFDRLEGVPVMVFVSGHPAYEFRQAIANAVAPRERIGALLVWRYGRLIYSSDAADTWICHTLTACEETGVANRGNYVLLRQFVLPDEVAFYDRFYQLLKGEGICERLSVRVFAYLSYADLPGLKLWSLLRIFNRVRRRVKRRVTFMVEDPRIKRPIQLGDAVQIIGRMPLADFLRILGTSDLYIETSIDEELRLTSFDAMLLRVPVAKILHPVFYGRQDYTEDEILIAGSANKLVELITEYINNIEYYHEYFSHKVHEFVNRKRLWDAVKGDLVRQLNET
jgi:hypothetical protein